MQYSPAKSEQIEHLRLLHMMSKEVLEILLRTNLDLDSVLETIRIYTGFDVVEIYLKDEEFTLEDAPVYLSKSIIPIRSASACNFGVIYIADKQKDYFGYSIIEIFENIALNISIALMRAQALKDNLDLLESLTYKNHLLESFKIISHLLLTCDEDTILNQILQIVGESLQVSRIYLFKTLPLDKNNYNLNYTYEWCNKNILPQIDNINLKNISFKDLKVLDIQETLLNNKPYIVNNIEELEKESQEIFIIQDIKSFILVPILYPFDTLYGFIGIDVCDYYRDWKYYEINSLINLSNLISSFIEKCYLEKRLNKFINNQSIILNNLDSYVWFFRDKDTYGFMNEKYYIDFIERQDSDKIHEERRIKKREITYKNDCLLNECHIKEESDLQISTNEIVLTTNKSYSYQQWLTNKSDNTRLLKIKKTPISDGYILCIAEDITNQHEQDKKIIKTLTEIYYENSKTLNDNIRSMQDMYQV